MNANASTFAGAAPTAAPIDLAAIKTRQQQTWSSGNYSAVGTMLQIVGEELAEAMQLKAGETVLDVAAGNGNATLAAARRFAEVTSTDYVPELIERGRARAEAEGLSVTFREADAEALPFGDASFDVVMSTFGVMFTPDHEKAAMEMARVTRPGGRIGLANWTPASFVGQIFRTIGQHLPPPAGLRSPALWGTREHLSDLFGAHAATINTQKRQFVFRYRSVEHWLDHFRTNYGPMLKAFAALDAEKQTALAADLIALAERFNRSGDRTMAAPSEYLEIVINRR